jgi:3-hydroxybutyryl-CoA dehydrogenase
MTMKKVLVVGDAERVKEFKMLNLQHAEVTYHEYASFDSMELDWNSESTFGEGAEDEDEDEDDNELVFGEAVDDEEDDLIFVEEDDDEGGEEESEGGDEYVFGGRWEDDDDEDEDRPDTDGYDIVFDLNFDDDESSFVNYLYNEGQVVIACAVKKSLAEMVSGFSEMDCKIFGINALPTFINRPKLEMSMLQRADHMVLEATMKTLGLEYELVQDQVGMVTPRVVSMIINEAAFVLGEGTATVEAVDQAMKLGTNYPQGPFEWCDKIGVWNVVEVIEALHKTYGDGKYKLAPALRRQRDLDLHFYPQA